MPSYFYHLKFELYPPTDAKRSDVWVPTAQSTVFDDLPAHPAPPQDDASETSRENDIARSYGAVVTRDWRFGRVSIDTIDTSEAMAAETSRAAAAPALGPSFSGPGTATKAACVKLETHHTELGWGVVHFYRDEHDGSAAPGLVEAEQAGSSSAATAGEEDCTTLCIPAVPAYMSPGDLWGFVGERWRGDISHCRMVMTSRMNRYLVLLKFRHSKVAREWKKMFDGKVFNTMEVC